MLGPQTIPCRRLAALTSAVGGDDPQRNVDRIDHHRRLLHLRHLPLLSQMAAELNTALSFLIGKRTAQNYESCNCATSNTGRAPTWVPRTPSSLNYSHSSVHVCNGPSKALYSTIAPPISIGFIQSTRVCSKQNTVSTNRYWRTSPRWWTQWSATLRPACVSPPKSMETDRVCRTSMGWYRGKLMFPG